MRKNIIQSKTEPNKNDIWLSEEGLKKYGKKGWEPLGGGSNNSGGYTDMMVLHTKDNAILTEEQFNEIEQRVKNGCLFELKYHEPDGTLTYYSQGQKTNAFGGTSAYLFNNNFGVASKDVSYGGDIIFIAIKTPDGYGFVGMPISNLPDSEIPVLRTPKFYYNGDGTKFLSDDGTYKEVSGGSEPYNWNGNNDESTMVELKQAILDNRKILFNNIECIAYIMNGIIMVKGNIPIVAPFLVIDNNNNMEELKSNNFFIKKRSTIVSPENYCYFDITQDTIIYIQSGGESEILPNTNEFNGEFTFGDTIYNVSFSAGLKWSTDSVLEYKPNHTYQFRILNNRGVMKEFANA